MAIEINEYFTTKPPFDVKKTIRKLLNGIPQKYVGGLKTIVIRESTTLNYKQRRSKIYSRKDKVKINECLGLYHQRWKAEPAWIELYVNNIYNGLPKFVARVPFLRELVLAKVLFHEIGHHIHFTKSPEFKDEENVAEVWCKRLGRYYFWRKHWFIMGFLYPFIKINKWTKKLCVKK